MSKQLLYSAEVRRRLATGVEKLANAVAVTLGPKGRNVLIEKGMGAPLMTKDGVTVAKEVKLEDQYENLGAQTIKEAAIRTNNAAGDGTTTATVLAHSIISEGLKLVEAGHDPMELKRGIEVAMSDAIDGISLRTRPIASRDDLFHIASISANNDTEIGEKIAEAFDNLGKDGVVTVEQSTGFETYVEYQEGMQYDKGYLSPYFSNTEQFTVEYDNPYILLSDEPIISAQSIAGLLETTRRQNRPIVLVAKDVQGDALTALVVNNSRGVINAAATRAPSFGDRQRLMMEDLAILTGATVVGQNQGLELKDIKPDHLGGCDRIKITSRDTTIVNGHGDKKAIDERVGSIRAAIENETSDFMKEQYQERLAKLSGGVATIYVGGSTEIELVEKKHRVEDALSATRAAIEMGVVPGGGVALLKIANDMGDIDLDGKSATFHAGYDAVRKAMEAPIRRISKNAAASGDVVIERLTADDQDFEYGWNAKDDYLGNMYEMGIIDPAKVTITALRNACSVAGMFLTTECAIIDVSAVSVASNNDMLTGGM